MIYCLKVMNIRNVKKSKKCTRNRRVSTFKVQNYIRYIYIYIWKRSFSLECTRSYIHTNTSYRPEMTLEEWSESGIWYGLTGEVTGSWKQIHHTHFPGGYLLG